MAVVDPLKPPPFPPPLAVIIVVPPFKILLILFAKVLLSVPTIISVIGVKVEFVTVGGGL